MLTKRFRHMPSQTFGVRLDQLLDVTVAPPIDEASQAKCAPAGLCNITGDQPALAFVVQPCSSLVILSRARLPLECCLSADAYASNTATS